MNGANLFSCMHGGRPHLACDSSGLVGTLTMAFNQVRRMHPALDFGIENNIIKSVVYKLTQIHAYIRQTFPKYYYIYE